MIEFEARDLAADWAKLHAQAQADAATNVGFPGATDITHDDLAEVLSGVLLNNIGSPYDGGLGRNHTKDYEVDVVNLIGDWLGAPPSRWGYVTSGSTEAIRHALLDARRAYPNAVVYSSAAAHFKVAAITDELLMPLVVISTDADGRMAVDDLAGELARRRDRPALVVAVAGTTITEAVDDVPAIVTVCERLAIRRRRIHVDAALSGLPLTIAPVDGVPAFDFTVPGVTSINVSGHKFLSTLQPSGVLLYTQPPYAAATGRISYTGTADVTISGSRSGHLALLLYSALYQLGSAGHRRRALACRELAAYACRRLTGIGVAAKRLPHAFTVYFPPPPAGLAHRSWVIPGNDQYAHLICMPQITRTQIDELVADWAELLPKRQRGLRRSRTPVPATTGGMS
jgi:histidine decarboxylase